MYKYATRKYGKDSPVEAIYYKDADFQKIIDFANERKNDKNRSPYSLIFPRVNCKTFAKDAIKAGRSIE